MKNILIALIEVLSILCLGSYDYIQTVPGDVYVQTNSGNYIRLSGNYNPALCENTGTEACAYQENFAGNGIVTSSFTTSQAHEWLTAGFISIVNSSTGYYVNE